MTLILTYIRWVKCTMDEITEHLYKWRYLPAALWIFEGAPPEQEYQFSFVTLFLGPVGTSLIKETNTKGNDTGAVGTLVCNYLDIECRSNRWRLDTLRGMSTKPSRLPWEVHTFCSCSIWLNALVWIGQRKMCFYLRPLIIIILTTGDFSRSPAHPHTYAAFFNLRRCFPVIYGLSPPSQIWYVIKSTSTYQRKITDWS